MSDRPPGWKPTFDPSELFVKVKTEFTRLERETMPGQNWRAAVATSRYIRTVLLAQFEEGCEQQLLLKNGSGTRNQGPRQAD